MNTNKRFAQTILSTGSKFAVAGLAVLSIGLSLTPEARAEKVLVQRGPNSAASFVEKDNIPVDAKLVNPKTIQPSSYPVLQTRGPNNAAHITRQTEVTTPSASSKKAPKVITRGPNGAAFIVD